MDEYGKYGKWYIISGIILAVGFLTVLAGALTDVYEWGNPKPILITGAVIFVIGGVLHRIKG